MSDLQHFTPVLNDKDILHQQDDMAPYLMDWRGQFDGSAQGVLFPRSTEQVAQIMAIADDHNITIVPQGGNTGLVGGGIPDKSGQSIVLSLTKMNKVRELSVQNRSMIVESGPCSRISHNCWRCVSFRASAASLTNPASKASARKSSITA